MRLPSLCSRRLVWWPTWLGWVVLGALLLGPSSYWWIQGEAFLARTHRRPAEVLVVESWIGSEGIRAAAAEFHAHGYRYIAATGGLTGRPWSEQRWRLSEGAERELTRLGIPRDRIVLAEDSGPEGQRTFDAAAQIRRALQRARVAPTALNVFTLSTHTRRSRLVFAKVFDPVPVGSVAWIPPNYNVGRWWRSSNRAEEFLKESVGYFFEATLNSGRMSNRPVAD